MSEGRAIGYARLCAGTTIVRPAHNPADEA